MINDITQSKICCQEMTPNQLKILRNKQYTSKQDYQILKAISIKNALWSQGKTIIIKFLDSPSSTFRRTWGPNSQYSSPTNWPVNDTNGNIIKYDPLEKYLFGKDIITCVKTIVKERFNPIINLNLVFADEIGHTGDCDIRISFRQNVGSKSYVGLGNTYIINQSEPTMILGWFDVATVIHEFGHALGLGHEHQSPTDCPDTSSQTFKNQFCNTIQWNLPVLYEWAKRTQNWDPPQVDQQIVYRYNMTQVNGTQFDPNSIMLYFFPNNFTLNNKGTSINGRLSKLDVIYINSLYPGSPLISKKVENPNDFYYRVYGEYINTNGILFITIKIADEIYAGSDSNIYITFGNKEYLLNNKDNTFNRNSLNKFSIPNLSEEIFEGPFSMSIKTNSFFGIINGLKIESVSLQYNDKTRFIKVNQWLERSTPVIKFSGIYWDEFFGKIIAKSIKKTYKYGNSNSTKIFWYIFAILTALFIIVVFIYYWFVKKNKNKQNKLFATTV